MRPEPIEFAAVSALRAKRRTTDFAKSVGRAVTLVGEQPVAVLDQAFAEFVRVDAGTSPSEAATTSSGTPGDSLVDSRGSNQWRTATRELVADIAAQLETFDRQRAQLARLLENVEIGAITD